MTAFGVPCEIVAPTLVPVKLGDRVTTARRDAFKLAWSYRDPLGNAGTLTRQWA